MTTWMLLALAAPFLLLLAIVCVREPMRVALPIYTALIPFGGAVSVGSSPFASASSLVGLLLGGGLLAQCATARRLGPRLDATVPVWSAFLGVAAASTLWTIDTAITVGGLLVLASLVVVFLLVAVADADRTIVRRTETSLLVGSGAAVCFGLLQLIFEGGLASDTGTVVAEGGRFGNGLLGPNILAVTLLVPLAIAINRTVNPRDPGRPLVNGLLSALMLLGILMTGSRTGTLGAGAVLIAMVMAIPRGARTRLVVAVLVGAAAAAFIWTSHPFGLAERSFETATSTSGRVDIWQVGIAACHDYCVAGSGWGTFPDVYAQTQATVPGARVLTGDEGSYQPHNLWLLAIIELGVAGFLLLLVGLALTGYQAVRLPPHYRATAVGSVVGLLVGVFFLSSMEFKMFWLVLMLVALYRNVVASEKAAEVRHTADVGGA